MNQPTPTPATYLRVRNWGRHFENNRTRELKKLDWVPVPNKHDGDGFTELLDHPNGMAHYGAWHLILQVASKCTPRGTLLRDVGTIPQEGAETTGAIPHPPAVGCQTPHTARTLARITHGSESAFSEAIPRLVSIGWLEVCAESRRNPAPACGKVPMEGNGMEGKGKKGREGEGSEGTAPHHDLDSLDSSIPPNAPEDHAALYNAFVTEFGAWCPVTFTDAALAFRQHGLPVNADTWGYVLADLRSRPEHERTKYAARAFGFAVANVAKQHAKGEMGGGNHDAAYFSVSAMRARGVIK